MSTFGFAVDEAVRSLWRNRSSDLLAIVTIAVALFVFGLFAVAWVNAERVLAVLQDSAEVSVYLADTITPEERSRVEQVLAASPEVIASRFVSHEEARDRFADAFPDLAAAAPEGTGPVLPASFEVRLHPEAGRDAGALEAFAARLQEAPGVSDVRYDQRWLDRLHAIVRAARTVGALLSLVLALAAALTVTAVVRLALHARRQEIEIMQLVGAPIAAIRGPFVLQGVLQGALGAVLALVALYALHAFARGYVAELAGVLPGGPADLARLPWVWALGVLGGGVVVGCIGGVIATRGAR